MKIQTIFLIILLIIFASCKSQENDIAKYKILAKDSTDFYFVYKALDLLNKDSLIILSNKYFDVNYCKKDEKIKLGKIYSFKLEKINTVKVDEDRKFLLNHRDFNINQVEIVKNNKLPFFTTDVCNDYLINKKQ
jgi:hypothetical protein